MTQHRNPYPKDLRDIPRQTRSIWLVYPSLFAVLAGLMIDGGFMGAMVGIGTLTHWATIAIIALRRPRCLTRTDVELMRFGFYLWTVLAMLLFLAYIWYLSQPRM